MEREFSEIYARGEWHRTVGSGPGSDPGRVAPYLAILQEVLRREGVTRVADLGCGDWTLSSLVDWSGVDYVGVEVVPEVVEELNRRHARPGVRFVRADLTAGPLPEAELAIVKDVLQHWPNSLVAEFLPRLRCYPRVLITNDRRCWRRSWLPPFRLCDHVTPNVDTGVGGYRPLELRLPPFQVVAEDLGRFRLRDGMTHFEKEVLLLRHPHRGGS